MNLYFEEDSFDDWVRHNIYFLEHTVSIGSRGWLKVTITLIGVSGAHGVALNMQLITILNILLT